MIKGKKSMYTGKNTKIRNDKEEFHNSYTNNDIKILTNDNRELRVLKDSMNTILANESYNDTNVIIQIAKLEKLGNMSAETEELLLEAWEIRKLYAVKMKKDLKTTLNRLRKELEFKKEQMEKTHAEKEIEHGEYIERKLKEKIKK